MTTPLTPQPLLQDIIENFSMLDDWEDRYSYLIELGKDLTPLEDGQQTDTNKIQGCVSQVWLISHYKDGLLCFTGASDAHIVRGLVAISLTLFSHKTPEEIIHIDAQETFIQIGLQEHLTPQRSNGLKSMVERIKSIAASYC